MLSWFCSAPHAQVAGRGCSPIAGDGNPRAGQDHRPAHGQGTPSPLRPPSGRLRRNFLHTIRLVTGSSLSASLPRPPSRAISHPGVCLIAGYLHQFPPICVVQELKLEVKLSFRLSTTHRWFLWERAAQKVDEVSAQDGVRILFVVAAPMEEDREVRKIGNGVEVERGLLAAKASVEIGANTD